jgi:hypothetical protein
MVSELGKTAASIKPTSTSGPFGNIASKTGNRQIQGHVASRVLTAKRGLLVFFRRPRSCPPGNDHVCQGKVRFPQSRETGIAARFARTGSVLPERVLFCQNGFCFARTGSVSPERVLFRQNGFCFARTGSVLPERVLFCQNGFCFAGTGSVLPERVLFCRNGFCFARTRSGQARLIGNALKSRIKDLGDHAASAATSYIGIIIYIRPSGGSLSCGDAADAKQKQQARTG